MISNTGLCVSDVTRSSRFRVPRDSQRADSRGHYDGAVRGGHGGRGRCNRGRHGRGTLAPTLVHDWVRHRRGRGRDLDRGRVHGRVRGDHVHNGNRPRSCARHCRGSICVGVGCTTSSECPRDNTGDRTDDADRAPCGVDKLDSDPIR